MTIVIAAVLSVLIVVIDQVIKYLVDTNMNVGDRITIIDGLFYIDYTENRGAAFGMFQNATIIFSVVTVILVAVFFYMLVKKKFTGKLFTASVILIAGGGIGNLIDRVFRHFVIDYLSVSFFPPVCNFADYCVTIGAVLFIISIFFIADNRKQLEEKKPENALPVNDESSPSAPANEDNENE